jgi:uncharacterized protein HemX
MSIQSSSTPSGLHETSHNDTSTAVIATVVVIVAVMLAVGLAVYLFLQWRARQTHYDPERRPRASMAVDRRHVADQITPCGSTSHLVPHFSVYCRSVL